MLVVARRSFIRQNTSTIGIFSVFLVVCMGAIYNSRMKKVFNMNYGVRIGFSISHLVRIDLLTDKVASLKKYSIFT